jgi:Fe-S-cluster containining protein
MKFLSETSGLRIIEEARRDLRIAVSTHEVMAKDCQTCETRGLCCTDTHFVNVRISPLETKAIINHIEGLSDRLKTRIRMRLAESLENFEEQTPTDAESVFYSCPLFDKDVGCSVHEVKPGACIHHACYENKSDLPPAMILDEYEEVVELANKRVYGKDQTSVPIPLAIGRKWSNSVSSNPPADDRDREK